MTTPKRMSARTRELQCALIDEYRRRAPGDEAEAGLWVELLKSARSLATNSSESDGAQSRREFITKFHICLKEARECAQLLHVLIHATPGRAIELTRLLHACDEIIAILVSSLKTAKRNEAANRPHRR